MSGWRERSRAVAAVFLVVGVLAVQIALLDPARFGDHHTWIADLALPFGASLAVVGLAGAGASLRRRRSSQWPAWALLAVGMGCYAIGDLIWAWLELVRGIEPFPSLADGFYLAFYVAFVAGLRRLTLPGNGGRDWLRALLDYGIVMVAATVFIGELTLRYITAQAGVERVELVFMAAYPVMDLVLVYSLVRLLIHRTGSSSPWAVPLLLSGVLVQVCADLGFLYRNAMGSYTNGGWVDLAWQVSFLTLAMAGWSGWDSRACLLPRASDNTQPLPCKGLACFLPTAVGLLPWILLSGEVERSMDVPAWRLGLGILLLYVLISVRQTMSLRENAELFQSATSELHERVRVQEVMRRRDALLAAVAQSATELLRAPRWQDCINTVLQALGRASQVSRVYIFQTHRAPDGAELLSQRFEWVDEGASVQIDNPSLQNLPTAEAGFARWAKVLSGGEALSGNVREFPKSERRALEAQDIRSLVVVPIFVDRAWWGFIGFDECRHERTFSESEIKLLMTAAGSLGAAVARELADAKLRENETWTRTILEKVQAGILIVEPETHRIVAANPVAEKLLGRAAAELVGQACHHFVCPQGEYQCLASDLQHSLVNHECQLLAADGRLIPVLKTVVPVADRGRQYLLESFVDISARKQAEEELRQAHETLEDRIRRRTAELETANAAMRDSEEALRLSNAQLETALEELRVAQHQVIEQERLRALGSMASGIAHDFNNTLAPIVAYSELLLRSPSFRSDPEKSKSALGAIHLAAQDAAAVVQRLRHFYRHREETEAFDLVLPAELVPQAIELARPRWRDEAMAAGMTIDVVAEVAEMEPLLANVSELREALVNLIINASDAIVQGHRHGGRGRIVVAARQAGDDDAVIEVRDDGPGMSEEVRHRCLEPFFSTKGDRGTGLGLAMVYGIVQRHDGRIEIESSPGSGTTIRLMLPSSSRPAADRRQDYGSPVVTRDVLLVDDEPLARRAAGAYLEADGHRVTYAAGAAEALAALATHEFDLVVTDRAMPVMNGDRLAATIRRRWPGLPVLMLTGFGDMMLANEELPEGVSEVIGKPATIETLRGSMARIFGQDGGEAHRQAAAVTDAVVAR